MKKTDKFKNNRLFDDFEGISFKTITNQDNYEFITLETYIIDLFKQYISVINESLEYFTYYRGDILNLMEEDTQVFLEKKLNKFFIVGQKGVNFYRENEVCLDDELSQIVKHIDGESDLEFKNNKSKFISVSVGDSSLEIAQEYSKDCNNSKGEGLIIFGFEEINNMIDPSQLYSFPKELLELSDSEGEVLLREIICPDSIFGLFSICDGRKNFIINPWLVNRLKQLKDIKSTDRKDIIKEKPFFKINQVKFDEYLEELNMKRYAIRYRK